jgi:hypothetical protein
MHRADGGQPFVFGFRHALERSRIAAGLMRYDAGQSRHAGADLHRQALGAEVAAGLDAGMEHGRSPAAQAEAEVPQPVRSRR